ncbi:MAG: GerMN domain-containing protein [Nitrospirae bacterium]|nr:GerMN domain-containing protein [Nitrospirota bacterium]
MSKNNIKNIIIIAVVILLFIIALSGLWFYFYGDRNNTDEYGHSIIGLNKQKSLLEDKSVLNIYFPDDMKLGVHKVEIKRIFDSLELGKASVREFFSYYTSLNSTVLSGNVEILGIYYGADNMLYINLSRDLIRNFHGDAVDEYMFLRSLYMTVSSHIEVTDIKLLVDSHEISSLAGHYDLSHPLKHLFVNE